MSAVTDARPPPRRKGIAFPIMQFAAPAPDATAQAADEALDEADVLEFASRLLSARDERERNHLIGATITHAADRAGGMLTPAAGSALGGLLKSVARRRLSYPTPGQALGLDLAGLDGFEQEFEATAGFVRLAAEAARHAAEERLIAPPRHVAQAALVSAADLYAPPLVSVLASPPGRSVTAMRREHAMPTRVSPFDDHSRPPSLQFEAFEYDPEMDYFLGGVVRSVGRAAGGIARAASKAANTVGKIPVLGDVARAGIGAVRLGMGPAAIAIDAGSRLARGQSLGAALKGAVVGQVDAVRDQLKLAEMVAPFVPGIGTGVAAALGAANALAAGQPITEAVLAAARGALPGGAIAQAAFDTALNLAKGKNIGEALLATARDRLPGGPVARAAFDGALALAKGKKLQDAAFAAAGHILPPSPYAADALSFVKRVANGQNVQQAALSVAGQRVLRQVSNQASLAGLGPPGAAAARAATRAASTLARGQSVVEVARAAAQRQALLRRRYR